MVLRHQDLGTRGAHSCCAHSGYCTLQTELGSVWTRAQTHTPASVSAYWCMYWKHEECPPPGSTQYLSVHSSLSLSLFLFIYLFLVYRDGHVKPLFQLHSPTVRSLALIIHNILTYLLSPSIYILSSFGIANPCLCEFFKYSIYDSASLSLALQNIVIMFSSVT